MAEAAQALRLRPAQRMVIAATWLGWTLDAFDFFLMVFVQKAIATAFHTSAGAVAEALFLTLAARPLGALAFGWLADRIGRRPVLMAVVLLFSGFSALSGLATSLPQLLLIRAAFGFAMGGEWGIGASLAMESIPARLRGRVSGLLQAGYPSGYLLASLAFALLFDRIGWRGMFFLGIAPAFLVLLIRLHVEESPAFVRDREAKPGDTLAELARNWKLALYLIVLMTAFNFFSHGTQDEYPLFLQTQRHFGTRLTGIIGIVMNIGAICGAFLIGPLSERIGRRRAIVIASLCALPLIPLWVWTTSPVPVALGAFLMQAAVQGAWAVVPAYLNELSPAGLRAMFPGFVYQLGNLLASRIAVIQAGIAESHHGDFALALGSVAALTAGVLAVWSSLGPEPRGARL
ncbi:MAG: MFS transporter [Sphingomonadales bacterium]|nr:MFS transporter [Sphingomonadales bacterium]